MIEFKSNTPTIAQVYQYTYMNRVTNNRFSNAKRDVLKSKIKIQKRTVYRKNKEGKFTTPEERLYVYSESAPQYYPYNKLKGKNSKRQMKIRHEYDIICCIQKDYKGQYNYWNSKIIWRVGSLKKYPKIIPQNKVATIHSDTRYRLERKYAKLPTKERQLAIKKEIAKIKKNAKYISDSDYVSRELGINGDYYFRVAPWALRLNCSYGRVYYTELPKDIGFTFFDKHMLSVIDFLIKVGVISVVKYI